MHSHINRFPTKNEILFQQLDKVMYEKFKGIVFIGKKIAYKWTHTVQTMLSQLHWDLNN